MPSFHDTLFIALCRLLAGIGAFAILTLFVLLGQITLFLAFGIDILGLPW